MRKFKLILRLIKCLLREPGSIREFLQIYRIIKRAGRYEEYTKWCEEYTKEYQGKSLYSLDKKFLDSADKLIEKRAVIDLLEELWKR